MGGGGSCFQEEKPESVCVCVFNFWLHPVACGTLVPQPGIKPASPALEGRVLTTGLLGKSLKVVLENRKGGEEGAAEYGGER